MPSTYYLGTSPDEALGDSPRYFYGLRRNNDGELFFVRSDQLKDTDDVEINTSGSINETFEDFEAGIDFLDGIDTNHELVYDNLKYPQYKCNHLLLVSVVVHFVIIGHYFAYLRVKHKPDFVMEHAYLGDEFTEKKLETEK
jgi:hypothetical protein